MSLNVLILGANGFIGSNLCARILKEREWQIQAMDLNDTYLIPYRAHPRFHFTQGNILAHKEWVEHAIADCDLVLPLVAIATPAVYVRDPLAVFELDFEANLEIVRHCVKYQKRILFPSTSEVYGISPDAPYDEETSNLTVGPINKERWIYSCCKQLMDRIIYAYGKHHGLKYTLFRPFNWFGPNLDNVLQPSQTTSRVVSQFLGSLLRREDIVLIGGGMQKRCFTYIDDATDALLRMIENRNGCADQRIFNIGHPGNEISIAELADTMLDLMAKFPGYHDIRSQSRILTAQGEEYYGAGYQDIASRVPTIERAQQWLEWQPRIALRDGLRTTIAHYCQ